MTVAVDAGTTGVRALVVDQRARVVDLAYRELTQYFPQPGWVEHDPDEIWSTVRATLGEVAGRLGDRDLVVTALGVTNQRETVVAWDKASGRPLARAIVWQDRRTASDCQALADEGHLPLVRQRTGLVLDPYFSATKMRWLLREGGVALDSGLALGTVDAWVLWNLTGGADGGVFATDVTNASRTMLYDIVERRWSAELSQLFDIPLSVLPEVGPSSGRFGTIASSVLGADSALSGVPVSAMAGDQHAALFGQACFETGMTKVTIGTGSFVLMNAGSSSPAPVEGLITTVAWDLGGATVDHGAPPPAGDGGFAYALEGSVFASGAGAQWLRDGLGLFEEMAELEPLADSVASSEGVVVVPAFTGLGSPNWDPDAPRHDRRPQPWERSPPAGSGDGRGDGLPGARRPRCDGCHRYRALARPDGRRGRGDGAPPPADGRPDRSRGPSPGVDRDHGHRRRHHGGARRGNLDVARRTRRTVDLRGGTPSGGPA